ncbi:MAG: alpha-amylase family glycosyl hydrolase [Bacteroidales bacterium]
MLVTETTTPEIFHLALPVRLALKETNVLLKDYFVNCKEIVSVKTSTGLSCQLSEDKETVIINVENQNFSSVATLQVTTNKNIYTIPLLKSRKIHYVMAYHPFPGSWFRTVQVAGSFNSWNPAKHIFSWRNHRWELDLYLEPGIYDYQLIADGNWFTDPDNPNKVNNGYGGFNSLLKIVSPFEDQEAVIFSEKTHDTSIIVHSDKPVDGFLALWQNFQLDANNIFRNNNKLMITFPEEAKQMKRSFIRVWGYNNAGATNDLLIPLEYGKVVTDASVLTRDDKEAQIIYFIMVDRYKNGDKSTYKPVQDPDLHPKLNYYGGNLAGINEKIKDKYLTSLGVNTLWISPLSQNPEKSCSKYGRKSTGYHGYWPVINTKIDERFGDVKALYDLGFRRLSMGVQDYDPVVQEAIHRIQPFENVKKLT